MNTLTHPLQTYRRTEFRARRICLRPAAARDQELMFGWRSHVDTSRFLSGAAPESMAKQREWFERVCADMSHSYHIVEDEGVPIGYTSMFNADPSHPDAEWGLVIGTDRKPGDARVIAPLCCSCAFNFAGLDSLYVCINAENVGAIRRVEQMGARPFTGPSIYRKKGELLLRITPDEFEERLHALADGNPALTGELAVETHIAEAVI